MQADTNFPETLGTGLQTVELHPRYTPIHSLRLDAEDIKSGPGPGP